MPLTTCPDRAQLRSYLLGELPERDALELQPHLVQCRVCLASLATLKGDDAFVAAMRARPVTETLPEPHVVADLIHRLRDLPSAGTGVETVVSLSDAEREQFDFLRLPQASDEIGRLGGYRVLKVLGQGGMGVVFEAEDPQLERRVALKVMRPAIAQVPGSRERFLREARAAAAVIHDNLIGIHQVGEDNGVAFLAMPFLEGETLEARLKRDGRLPIADVLRIGRETALGLAAAHSRGLIHRDIKPANLWLESSASGGPASGGRQPPVEDPQQGADAPRSPGRVKILDFGLARAARGAANLTAEGVVVGTPAYMAPEQARGGNLDSRADLFSLGCVLYHASTGQQPFRGADALAVLMSLANDTPAPPRRLNQEVPAPLNDLIVRLMARNPKDRPADAQAVVAALQAIEASRVRPPARSRSWLAACILVAILGGSAAYFYAPVVYRPATSHKGRPALTPPSRVCELRRFEGCAGQVWCVALSPDGTRALAGSGGIYDQGRWMPNTDTGVRIWDVVTGKEVSRFAGHNAPVKCAAFSPDGKCVLSGDDNGAVCYWDAASGKELDAALTAHDGTVWSVAFSPDGRLALSAGKDKVVRVWDVAKHVETGRFAGHTGTVRCVAFSRDGTLGVSAGQGGARVWEVPDGRVRRAFDKHDGPVQTLAVTRDGRVLTGGLDGKVWLWSLADGEEACFDGQGDAVQAVAVEPAGRQAVSSSAGKVLVWDPRSLKVLETFAGHEGSVPSVAISADGRFALSGGSDRTVRLWGLPPLE